MAEIRVNSTGAVKLYDNDDSNFVGLQAGSISSDVTFTLPTADGSNGQFMKTDGSGALSFATANNYVHPNHSGEVTSTSDGATVIADNIVDEANLKVSNSPSNGYVLTAQSGNTGGLTWAEITGTTINNNADNRIITGSGTANTLEGEANLTYDGSTLTIKPSSNVHQLKLEQNNATDYWSLHADSSGGPLSFQRYTGGAETEKMRLLSDGKFFVGTSVDGVYNDSSGAGGFNFNPTSTVALAVNGARPLMLNRIGDGGTIAEFYQGGGFVGSISESGGTVSYNAFAGSHWSRLADNSKPTILRGTVMESISTLCNWYQVEFTVTIDEENVIKKESITLPSGKSVGDIIKHTYQGVEYDAKILKEDNERLPMCKISDTEDSKAVYGVFMTWDNDPDDGVNDMLVTALGAFVVRIHKDETVAIGDYLQSKGDGTAKKQADDILRASTIAKVTSTEKTHEYADGSYCVPCTLHCG